MEWLLLVVTTLLAVEVFVRTSFNKNIKAVLSFSKRSMGTLSSKRVSDHWKEKVLLRYSLEMFKNSVLLLVCFLVTASVIIGAHIGGSYLDMDLLSLFMTPLGMSVSLVLALLYVYLRGRIIHDGAGADYSFLQKVLHYVALANNSVLEATLDAELAFSKSKRRDQSRQNHVFVSGLARGGTTILMRSLYETGLFASLTYADMPFVLAPNLWSKISGKSKKTIEAKERAHGDGILVDVDSPEALDEVFWRAFSGEEYIHKDGLSPCSGDDETIEKYRNYISSILAHYHSDRYLSKNNNNILRFGSIVQALPNARILIPFRDPVQHAHSLLTQHLLFCEKQAEDPFVRRYMVWLGHHEFGLEHKPFKVEGGRYEHSDPRTIEYWLQQWRNVYQYLLLESRKYSKNTICISYELLCTETDTVWGSLCKTLDVDGSKVPAMRAKVREVASSTDESLLAEVGEIYQQLTEECRGALLV